MRWLWIVCVAWCSLSSLALARRERPNQIPNGPLNGCSNCHLSTAGGGIRTPFGYEIEAHFLTEAATVDWGPALAALDSDGDGRTNGQEVQDPTGAWRPGQPQPGDPALVTNPGVFDPPVSAPALGGSWRAMLALSLGCLVSAAARRR